MTVDRFYSIYIHAFEKAASPPKFLPLQFNTDFALHPLDFESLQGRLDKFDQFRNWSLLAVVVSIVVFDVLLKMTPLAVFTATLSVMGYLYFSYEAIELEKVVSLSMILRSDDFEASADALVGAGPSALQKSWEFGCVRQEYLETAVDTINRMGQSICLNNGSDFDTARLQLIDFLRVDRMA